MQQKPYPPLSVHHIMQVCIQQSHLFDGAVPEECFRLVNPRPTYRFFKFRVNIYSRIGVSYLIILPDTSFTADNQDVFIFKGTVMDNITLGRTDISSEEIVEAAKFLNAHDFIMQLPKGYKTEINTEGSNLSLGQKQLISFIRALVIKPKILLLDEATSSVDTHTERLIQEGIEKLMQGRTSIAIAHRLSTIIHSDRIIVLKEGNIIEDGTHHDLIALRGFYWKLYTTQFSKELT